MKIDGSSVSRGDYIYYFGELGNWQRNKYGKVAKQIDLEQRRGEERRAETERPRLRLWLRFGSLVKKVMVDGWQVSRVEINLLVFSAYGIYRPVFWIQR